MHAILNALEMIASRGLVLGALIFIHEMGHYLAARWRGVHVEAFSIGFGPKLLSWTDKHETVWKLCVLPLGGFVKMHGMALNVGDELDTDQEAIRHGRAFFEKSVLSRAIVVAAGPIANFLLAAVLFSGLYATLGRPVVVDHPPAVIGQIGPGTSAADAGLQPGDKILEIDGVKIGAFEDMRRIVAASAGKTLALRVHRGTQDLTVATLIKPKTPGDMSVGQLGVAAGGTDRMERLAVGPAIVAGVAHTGSVMWQILAGLGHLFITGQGVHELAGPIGVVMLSGQVAKLGAAAIVAFTAFLSINLGLVNLLPIPVLDGGHLMFYAAEAVRGRPLPARALDYGYRLGFAVIASFFLFISWNDLVHTGAVRWVAHLIG